jgi:hypothetical protein
MLLSLGEECRGLANLQSSKTSTRKTRGGLEKRLTDPTNKLERLTIFGTSDLPPPSSAFSKMTSTALRQIKRSKLAGATNTTVGGGHDRGSGESKN